MGRGLRYGALALTTIMVAGALTSDPAEARRRKHHHAKAKVSRAYTPPYSSLVVDANTGAVLQNTNGDALRHPASLTKIMTLYLLFERLEAGKISLASELRVSAHAAAQSPSKLNLSPGDTIDVESAIKAVVTKSANDVAVVIAENLGGDEPSFARLMTQKARALGMKNTTYYNASGLPNDEQWTTARDQVTLGRAIQERFPRYYRYFSTRTFVYEGRPMRNHNHLLGRVEGMDGIKTGYVNASGFNLVTSVRRAGRHVVAAIFGGRTARARDAQMEGLIGKYTLLASAKQTAPAIAENANAAAPRLAAAESIPVPAARPEIEAKPEVIPEPKAPAARLADNRPVEAEAARALRATAYAPEVGSKDPIRPVAVKTLAVKGSTMQTASLAPVAPGNARITTVKTAAGTPDPRFEKPIDLKTNNQAVAFASADAKSEPSQTDTLPPSPPGAKPGVLGVLPVQVASADPADAVTASTHARARNGWFIQVGALESEKEAKERLSEVRSAVKVLLKNAEAYTETVKKGSRTFYRARFAGFDEAGATKACREIKASKFVCMPARN